MRGEKKQWIKRSTILLIAGVLIAGILFFIYMTIATRPYVTAATHSDKESPLLFKIWEVEGQIDRIDEAITKNWFPDGDDQVMLLETKRVLNEKLAEAKTRYEKERRLAVKEIVKDTSRTGSVGKTAP